MCNFVYYTPKKLFLKNKDDNYKMTKIIKLYLWNQFLKIVFRHCLFLLI